VLAGLAATGAAAAPPFVSAAATGGLDLADRRGQGLIFRKLAYAADERVGFSWLRGVRYALIDTDPLPLWEMHVGSLFSVRDLADGRYEVTTISTSFYTDLQTGAYLTRFLNPSTNQTIEISYFPPRPGRTIFDGNGPVAPATPPGLTRTDRIGPAEVVGDQVWITADVQLRGAAGQTPGERPIRVNDLTTYFGGLHEVADPSVMMPLSGQVFSDINSWPRWLGMGDRPGDYYSRCLGGKVAAYDAMPETWLRLMREVHPDIARDPAAALRR
jgi:hypothetical protein